MTANNETEGRNRWKTARERERMKVRHEIRNRVMFGAADASTFESDPSRANDAAVSAPSEDFTEEQVDIIRTMLRHVEAGKSSAFSLSTLSKHYALLNRAIPTTYLSKYKLNTLCTSRFGTTYVCTMIDYVEAIETCTFMEYASWLGEYRLLHALLAGGLDPTIRGRFKNKVNVNSEYECRRCTLSTRVMRRFFDAFPYSLSSYILKRVVDMRKSHWQHAKDNTVCLLCGVFDSPMLRFGSPCNHVFCENCFWQDLCDNIDEREGSDVVLCPVCGVYAHGDKPNDKNTFVHINNHDYSASELRERSKRNYQALPVDGKALKKTPKQNKRKKSILSSSWSEAVMPSVGRSQDVRRDKFFRFTEQNAHHYVKGCLMAGVEVDLTNEYGQTALHIGAWRGYSKLVKLLLSYGSDPAILANGGVSALGSSKAAGHGEVSSLLQEFETCTEHCTDFGFFQGISPTHDVLPKLQLEVLINTDANHPGAGSFTIDECLSSQCLDTIVALWQSLPVDQSDSKKKNKALCSERSYYCDCEGHLQNLLMGVVCQAFPSSEVVVFPHMRFLHYVHPATALAPHVDLSRKDITGQSSTHTFILYLFDCQAGGETSLLSSLSGDGRDEVIARVAPRRGRLLLFPHLCPHEGNEVIDVPKVLLRGEVKLTL